MYFLSCVTSDDECALATVCVFDSWLRQMQHVNDWLSASCSGIGQCRFQSLARRSERAERVFDRRRPVDAGVNFSRILVVMTRQPAEPDLQHPWQSFFAYLL